MPSLNKQGREAEHDQKMLPVYKTESRKLRDRQVKQGFRDRNYSVFYRKGHVTCFKKTGLGETVKKFVSVEKNILEY